MSNRSFKTLFQDFVEFEAEHDLLGRTVDDVHFWERIRFSIHQRLVDELHDDGPNDAAGDEFGDYLAGGRLFLENLVSRNPFVAPSGEFLFYSTGRRKQLDDGLWWDIYVDPIVESVDETYVFLERPYDVSHLTPAKTENRRYTDSIVYASTICEKLGIVDISFSPDEASLLEDITEEIARQFDVSVPVRELVERDLTMRLVQLPLFRRVIRRIDPELAFLVTSYNGRETFVEACRLEDVPVVELQHGVITKYHLGYSYPNAVKRAFPDYFFAFGEFWKDTVDLPLPDENVFSVGYPFLEREARRYDDVESTDKIVFISQKVVGPELSRFAVTLAESEEGDTRIVYKLHPKEYDTWEKEYPWLQTADIDVVTDSPALYRIFAESTAQIGVYSTALFEGLYFGLDTYVVDLPGHEYMDPLIEAGCAHRITYPGDYLSAAGTDIETFDKEYFFETEPIENFTRYAATLGNR